MQGGDDGEGDGEKAKGKKRTACDEGPAVLHPVVNRGEAQARIFGEDAVHAFGERVGRIAGGGEGLVPPGGLVGDGEKAEGKAKCEDG